MYEGNVSSFIRRMEKIKIKSRHPKDHIVLVFDNTFKWDKCDFYLKKILFGKEHYVGEDEGEEEEGRGVAVY